MATVEPGCNIGNLEPAHNGVKHIHYPSSEEILQIYGIFHKLAFVLYMLRPNDICLKKEIK